MFKHISASHSSALIQQRNPLIFDVRDVASYQAAHLPNAVYLSDQTLKSTIRKGPRNRTLLIYCYHGNASQDIAKLFCDFGFLDVYSLDGGFASWQQAMPPTQVEPPALPAVDIQQWLLAQGFSATDVQADKQTGTPLIKACQLGQAEMAAALIQAGARLNALDTYGNDAVWAASFSGDLPTLQVLRNAGADLNWQNPNGNTSLMYAASAGKTAVVEYLLQAGANPHLQNQDGYTALDLAATLEILTLLKPYR